MSAVREADVRMERGSFPGGPFDFLEAVGSSAVDSLVGLTSHLDSDALARLVSTCHALRDGPFSRTQQSTQCLLAELERRRAVRIQSLQRRIGFNPLERIATESGVLDLASARDLSMADCRLLAGLCLRDPAAVRARAVCFNEEEEEPDSDEEPDAEDMDDESPRLLPLAALFDGSPKLVLGHRKFGRLGGVFLSKSLEFNRVLTNLE